MILTSKYRFFIPNLITLSSLASGVFAITQATRGHFYNALWLGFLCMIFDKFDGMVARKLNAQSNFGLEMDSLVDLVAFGIAPAVIFYIMVSTYSPFYTGWKNYILIVISVFWSIASALRLAKYNVVAQSAGFNQIFQGLPMPVAAGLILSPIIVFLKYFKFGGYAHASWDPSFFSMSSGTSFFTWLPVWVVIIGYGMISPLKVPKLQPPASGWMKYWFIGNAFLLYAIIMFRALPELLIFLSLQFLVLTFWFHFTSPEAKKAEHTSMLEAMSVRFNASEKE